MDADTLRLLLIALGVFLVAGVYFWERHKRADLGMHRVRQGTLGERAEPTLGDSDASVDEPSDPAGLAAPTQARADAPQPNPDDLDQALHELGDLLSRDQAQQPVQAGAEGSKKLKADPQAKKPHKVQAQTGQQTQLSEDATQDTDHYRSENAKLPILILQINVVTRGDGFDGPAIQKALEDVGMLPGDMNIYHRRHGDERRGPVVFSLASMVEPGAFPIKQMAGFRTPGLTLFAQLPGPQEGLAVFADMLFSAERIAADLDGELQDDTHSRMTKQTTEHIRGQILEHQRRVQVEKSKLEK